MKRMNPIDRGKWVAGTLYQSWRTSAPALDVPTDALDEVQPLLVLSGSAGLAWRRVRGSELEGSEAARHLREAFRHQVILSAVRESEIAAAVTALRAGGVDCVLGKGWAAARHYPELGTRPYGDADLYVSQDQYPKAASIVAGEASGCWVDLHDGLGDLRDSCFEEVRNRSVTVEIGNSQVRVFGEEDHLRLLCLHAMRHGACRPLWFCDIAAALESRSDGFDWDRFLRTRDRRSDAATCAVGVAHRLLGADIRATPLFKRAGSLPGWLISTVLSEWGSTRTPHGLRQPFATCLGDPGAVIRGLRLRWPNAVEATVAVGGVFNEWPRLPFKIAASAVRGLRFASRLRTARAPRAGG